MSKVQNSLTPTYDQAFSCVLYQILQIPLWKSQHHEVWFYDENGKVNRTPVEETGYEDAEEAEDNEDDYMVEQLEEYGLTKEEISDYQNLPVD